MTTKPKPFTADMFAGDRFHSAADDAKFGNWLVGFVEAGCPDHKFPEWAYKRLMHMFGFIAHYNRGGFTLTYFDTPQQKVNFIRTMVDCWFAGFGPHGDLEKAIQQWLREHAILARYEREAQAAQEKTERAALAGLVAKYGVPEGAGA